MNWFFERVLAGNKSAFLPEIPIIGIGTLMHGPLGMSRFLPSVVCTKTARIKKRGPISVTLLPDRGKRTRLGN